MSPKDRPCFFAIRYQFLTERGLVFQPREKCSEGKRIDAAEKRIAGNSSFIADTMRGIKMRATWCGRRDFILFYLARARQCFSKSSFRGWFHKGNSFEMTGTYFSLLCNFPDCRRERENSTFEFWFKNV